MLTLVATLVLVLSIIQIISGQSNPIITKWTNSTGYNGYNGILADVSKIEYSSQFVYISTNSVPGTYTVGPTWKANPNVPLAQSHVVRFPLNPVMATTKKTAVGMGTIGKWLDGVSIYNANDGMSYNNGGVWYRNAFFWEGISFDSCLGHASIGGHYHLHVSPNCFFNYNDSSKHSPLLGYAFDGFPVYGTFGYSSANNSASSIKRLTSCYYAASYPNNQRRQYGNGTLITNTANYGPDINATYPSGAFLLDYVFNASSACDLDKFNGRFQVTPEYPNGIYAYIATIDSTGTGQYPFVIAPDYYYGAVSSTSTSVSINETTTVYFQYATSSNSSANVTTATTTTTTTTTRNSMNGTTIRSNSSNNSMMSTISSSNNSIMSTISSSNNSMMSTISSSNILSTLPTSLNATVSKNTGYKTTMNFSYLILATVLLRYSH